MEEGVDRSRELSSVRDPSTCAGARAVEAMCVGVVINGAERGEGVEKSRGLSSTVRDPTTCGCG